MRQVGAEVRAQHLRQVRKQPVRVLSQLAKVELQALQRCIYIYIYIYEKAAWVSKIVLTFA